jgi:predicted nucleic acid-binding protein
VSSAATGYVLDTNVVSELMRERPDPAVMDRLTSLDDSAWFITAVAESYQSCATAWRACQQARRRRD